MNRLKVIRSTYLSLYKTKQPISLLKHFNKLKRGDDIQETFGLSLAYSSVFSSMIEGNPIDIDSYLRYTHSGMNTNSKPFKEIEALKTAYEFASSHVINKKNLLKAHSILSQTLSIEKKYRGAIREKDVYIFGDGKKVYTGASKDIVKSEMDKIFSDIDILKKRKLSITEVFYYASMLHLTFVKIHPFADGNGRAARLLEKWFLAEILGRNAWLIKSEKLYQTRLKSYYKNVDLGNSYDNNNFDLSLPFLKMLPMALRIK